MALRSVEILIAEHRAVETALEELEGLINDFLTNSEVPDAAKQALGNLSDFLSRDLALHIRKEDDALFPALEKFLPREQGPLAVMSHEHREITQENQALRDGVAGLAEHPSTAGQAAAQIRDHGRSLVQELRSHLFKEEHVLFPLAEARLGEKEDREIVARFEAIASNPGAYRPTHS
jgi:regulator of cell morphogenesis and NO signaling